MLLHKNMTLRWKGEEVMWDFWSSVRFSFQIESSHKKERSICDCIKVTWALFHTHLQLLFLIIFTIILTLVSVCYIFSSTKQFLIFFFSNSKNNRRFDSSLFSQFRPRDGKTFCMHTYIHPWIGRNVFEETVITIHSNSYQHVVWNEKTSYAKRFPSTELRVILGVKLRRFSLFSSHYSLALLCWLLSDFLILFFVTH